MALVLTLRLGQVIPGLLQLDHQLVVRLVDLHLRVDRVLVTVDRVLHVLLGISQLLAQRASVGCCLQER
jgi:hypothetical protein